MTNELEKRLKDTIIDLIENKDIGVFYFGGHGDFDDLCYKVVSSLMRKYPFIKRIFFLLDERHLNYFNRPKWLREKDFEEYVYPNISYNYWYRRIYFRNIEMVSESHYVVFYVEPKENSGAYKAYKYAQKIKKDNINLFEGFSLFYV